MNALKRWFDTSILFKAEKDMSANQKWVLGLINLICVVVFWVVSSFLVNDLFESEIYRKPFLITYINTSCFSFYIIPFLKYEKWSLRQFIINLKKEWRKNGDSAHSDLESSINENTLLLPEDEDSRIGILETISLSFQFCTLWFCANLVTNSSLSYTSVASQTILSSTSSFFTLLVGFLYAVERINKYKVYGILLCFMGVLIVTKDDLTSTESHSNWIRFFGNALALSGALIYGVYTILLKLKTTVPNSRKERNLNTHLFFAFVGIFCFVSLWPIIIVLHVMEIETFVIPKDSHILCLLLINMFITFISDFCWCKAVLLTSPLTVTVGLSLTIPLAMVGDWVFRQFSFNWVYVFGAAIVTIGFLIINQDEKNDFVDDISIVV